MYILTVEIIKSKKSKVFILNKYFKNLIYNPAYRKN